MTLTSASTLAQCQAAYDDNASYEEEASPTKARAFITACRVLIRRIPRRATHGGRGGEEVEMAVEAYRQEINEAKRWLAVHGTSAAGVTVASFENFRT